MTIRCIKHNTLFDVYYRDRIAELVKGKCDKTKFIQKVVSMIVRGLKTPQKQALEQIKTEAMENPFQKRKENQVIEKFLLDLKDKLSIHGKKYLDEICDKAYNQLYGRNKKRHQKDESN